MRHRVVAKRTAPIELSILLEPRDAGAGPGQGGQIRRAVRTWQLSIVAIAVKVALGDVGRADNREEAGGDFGGEAHGNVPFVNGKIRQIGAMLKCETSQVVFYCYFPVTWDVSDGSYLVSSA
jgi:hypothetical protein